MLYRFICTCLIFLSGGCLGAFAQHEHHQHTEKEPETATYNPSISAGMAAMMRTLTGGPFRSMYAMGSGTGLVPAASPMAALHWMPQSDVFAEWMVMAHGQVTTGFNHQGGPRGVGKAEAQNWLMLMAERKAGKGRLMLRGMVTAEPLTAPHGGFPLLFQTGETYRNQPIIDAQHPHDAVMEAAASYSLPLGEKVSLQLYGGPVGEPALGPVAFMHRLSASENPAAPLGHHWMDSTHITHGVVTAALTAGKFKLETSRFHGRQPDENRWHIELGKLDSHSYRLWYAPTPRWAAQVSLGKIKNPEVIHTGDLTRVTASVAHNLPFGADGRSNWASALIWGRNDETDPFFNERYISNAYLFESTVNFKSRYHLYTRVELVDKQGLLVKNIFQRPGLATEPRRGADCLSAECGVRSAELLANARRLPRPSLLPRKVLHPDPNFIDPFIYNLWRRVGALTIGGVRDLVVTNHWRVGVGADVTTYHTAAEPLLVSAIYGKRPVSYRIFLRIRPNWLR